MKKLLTLILLALPVLAFAQGYGSEVLWQDTLTIDGASGGTLDTLNIGVFLRGYAGYPYFEFNTNAVKASSATDSLTMQWRRAKGIAVSDTFDSEPWITLKVKNNTTSVSIFDWADSSWYQAPIDFDGRPAPYIQLRTTFDGDNANDSLEMIIRYRDFVK